MFLFENQIPRCTCSEFLLFMLNLSDGKGFMWSYLRNQRSKQTNLVYLQFILNYALYSKNQVQKVVTKKPQILKYIIPLNYRLTGHPENFNIKLYYLQERLVFDIT